MGPLPPPVRAPTEPVGNHGGVWVSVASAKREHYRNPTRERPTNCEAVFTHRWGLSHVPHRVPIESYAPSGTVCHLSQVQTQGDSSRRRLLTAFGRI